MGVLTLMPETIINKPYKNIAYGFIRMDGLSRITSIQPMLESITEYRVMGQFMHRT